MRRLEEGVAISVAVHVALIAAVTAYEPEKRPEPPDPTPVPIEIIQAAPLPQPEVAPLDVALVDEPPAARAAEPPPPPPVPRRPDRAAIEATPRATIETAIEPPGRVEPTITPPPRSSYFDMRKGQPARIDLRLPSGMRDDLDHAPAGTRPDFGVKPTGQLQDNGGGTYRSEKGPFVVKVDQDGGVTIKDRKNFRIGLAPPTPKQVGQGITDWYRSDKGPDGQRGTRTLEKEAGGSTDAGDRSKTVIVPVVRGSFDITDAFMRRKGFDPYASAKLRYLDSTRDERVQIGTRHREQQLLRVHEIMTKNLANLWARTTDLAARKQALFELWDECVETGDPAVVEAGRSARRLVVAFIRARLTAGGADAYTTDELAALNRGKQSTARFAPYD